MIQQLSTNNFGNCKWIVNPVAWKGTHTTISSAIASASSGDDIFIMPGTYIENISVDRAINFIAQDCDSWNQTVIIQGKISFVNETNFCCSNICMKNGTSKLIDYEPNASSATVYFNNCNFISAAAGVNAINISPTNEDVSINFYNCTSYFNGTVGGSNYFLLLQSTLSVYLINCVFLSDNSQNNYIFDLSIQGNLFINNCVFGGSMRLSLLTNSPSIISNSIFYNKTPSPTIPSVIFTTSASNIGYFFNNFYYSNSSTVGGIVISGTHGLYFFNNTIFTNFTTAIQSTSTSVTYLSNLSTNAAIPYSTTSLTVNQYLTSSFYLGSQQNVTKTTCLGQQIRASLSSASATSLITTTSKTITNINLTPGIWDISAIAAFSGTVTSTQTIASISTTTNSLSANTGDQTVQSPLSSTSSSDYMIEIPQFRTAISSSTNYFLVVQQTFSLGTATAYGRISATRVG